MQMCPKPKIILQTRKEVVTKENNKLGLCGVYWSWNISKRNSECSSSGRCVCVCISWRRRLADDQEVTESSPRVNGNWDQQLSTLYFWNIISMTSKVFEYLRSYLPIFKRKINVPSPGIVWLKWHTRIIVCQCLLNVWFYIYIFPRC